LQVPVVQIGPDQRRLDLGEVFYEVVDGQAKVLVRHQNTGKTGDGDDVAIVVR
jgi:hypothetical protein